MNNLAQKRGNNRRSEGAAGGTGRSILWSRPGFLVRRLHQIHVAIFFEECAGQNITPVQFGVLSVLMENPGLDQITVAAKVGIDRTNVAEVIGRLEKRGLLTRQVNPADKRGRLVTLTPAGQDFVLSNRAAVERAQERLLAPLTPAEREQMVDLLSRLAEANNELGRAPFSGD